MSNMSSVDLRLEQVERVTAPARAKEPARFLPGQVDMWAFVLFEALVFTAYFTVYLVHRGLNRELFLQSQSHLNLSFGVFNTTVLLVSSWSVARCVQAARAGSVRVALTSTHVAMFFGVLFLAVKVLEWTAEIASGFTFTTNEFFEFYYFLTGIHFVHLLIGFIALGLIKAQLSKPNGHSQELIETCATYWHTVDFLWILIFALLYVMR